MSAYNTIGWFIISIPFLLIFACIAKKDGFKFASTVFLGVAALVVIIYLGVYLTKI